MTGGWSLDCFCDDNLKFKAEVAIMDPNISVDALSVFKDQEDENANRGN